MIIAPQIDPINYRYEQNSSGEFPFQNYLRDDTYMNNPFYSDLLNILNNDPIVPSPQIKFLLFMKFANVRQPIFDMNALVIDNEYLYYVLWRLFRNYQVFLNNPDGYVANPLFINVYNAWQSNVNDPQFQFFNRKLFPILVQLPNIYIVNYIANDPSYPDSRYNTRNNTSIQKKSGLFRPLQMNPILRRSDLAPSLHNMNVIRRYENDGSLPVEFWGTLTRGMNPIMIKELPQFAEWNTRNSNLYVVRFGSMNKTTVDGKVPCKWVKQRKNIATGQFEDDNTVFQTYAVGERRYGNVNHRMYELRNGMFDLVLKNDGTLQNIDEISDNPINYNNVMALINDTIFQNNVAYSETTSVLVPLTVIEMILRSTDENEFSSMTVPTHIYSVDQWRSIRSFIQYIRQEFLLRVGKTTISTFEYVILIWALFSKFLYPVNYSVYNFWNENFEDV